MLVSQTFDQSVQCREGVLTLPKCRKLPLQKKLILYLGSIETFNRDYLKIFLRITSFCHQLHWAWSIEGFSRLRGRHSSFAPLWSKRLDWQKLCSIPWNSMESGIMFSNLTTLKSCSLEKFVWLSSTYQSNSWLLRHSAAIICIFFWTQL